MSESVANVKTVQCKDPQVDLSGDRVYAIIRGASQVSWKPVSSTSVSNSVISFSAPPPSPGIIVGRKVLLRVPVRFTFACNTQGSAPCLELGTNDGPRAFPLQSVCDNMQCTINDTAVSVQISQFIGALLRYNNDVDQQNRAMSTTPTMLDFYQDYGQWTSFGDNVNPLGKIGQTASQQTRGGFPMTIVSNSASAAIVDAVFTEQLLLSPWAHGTWQQPGFLGVQTLDFTFNFSNLERMWSHSPSAAHQPPSNFSCTASFTNVPGSNQPQLLFEYLTPQPIPSIPKQLVYPYYVLQQYPTNTGSIAAGASLANVASNNIQLQGVPKRMYIFARRPNSDLANGMGYLYSDTFAGITNLQINFNNQSGLLSSATQQDLYQMSVKNGLNMNWAQFTTYTGSVIAVDFGTDIGLDPITAPGANGTYQLQVQANITNLHPSDAIAFTLYIVTVMEGTFTIEANRAVSQVGVVTPEDVLNSRSSPFIKWDDLKPLEGGDLFSRTRTLLQGHRGSSAARDGAGPKSMVGVGLEALSEAEEDDGKVDADASGGELMGGLSTQANVAPAPRKTHSSSSASISEALAQATAAGPFGQQDPDSLREGRLSLAQRLLKKPAYNRRR